MKSVNAKFNNFAIITAIIVGALNVITIHNEIIAKTIVFFEILILIFNLVKKKYCDYLGYYLVFLCLSVEYGFIANDDFIYDYKNFYNFKNTHILGLNLGILFILPLMFLGLSKISIIFKSKNKNEAKKFAVKLVILVIIALFMGVFTVFQNDNQIKTLPNLFNAFLDALYSYYFFAVAITISIIFAIDNDSNNIVKIKCYIISIIYGLMSQILTSYTFGIYGSYSGLKVLTLSTLYNIFPILSIIFLSDLLNKNINMIIKFTNSLLCIYCFLLVINNNASGKMIIITFLAICYFFFFFIANYKKYLMPLFISILLLFPIKIWVYNQNSNLFQYKFGQVISLFNYFSEHGFEEMSSSPKFRVAEWKSVVYELIEKPQFLVFGKGILGTIKDHTNSFGDSFVEGTFSEGEWSIGSFYNLHFIPANFLLCNGIIGLLFYFLTIVKCIFFLKRNTNVLVGTVWFALFFGYSVTLTTFGIIILMSGYYEIDTRILHKGE